MDDDSAGLSVGFEIDFHDSFGKLRQIDDIIGDVAANAFREFNRLRQASQGAIDVSGAISEMRVFSGVTKEMRALTRERNRAEKAGEALSRQLAREAEAFGKTKEQIRALNIEARTLAASQVGLDELAGRLAAQQAQAVERQRRAMEQVNSQLRERARLEAALERNTGMGRVRAADAGATFSALAARAAEDEARATASAAAAAKRHADEHARLAAMVRGSQAALEADTVAADRMRMATDPLYAATKRLNDEIAESTRLYHAGATAPAEYARQQQVLQQRLQQATTAHHSAAAGANRNAYALTQLSFQINDVATMAAMGARPMQIFASQAGQIYQVFQMADGGAKGLSAQIGRLALRFAPLAAAAGGAALAIKGFQNAANDGANMEAYARSLGLTSEQIKKLDSTTVTFGDTAKAVFQVVGGAIWDNIGPSVTSVWEKMKEWMAWIGSGVKSAANFLIGGFVGAFNAIKETWRMFPAFIGDAFYSGVNLAISAINALTKAAIDGLNWFAGQANKILPDAMQIKAFDSGKGIGPIANEYAGAMADMTAKSQAAMRQGFAKDYLGDFAGAVAVRARQNRRDSIDEQAEALLSKDSARAAGDKSKALSEQERAYRAAVKAAKDYLAAQIEETARIGLNAKQLRERADAAAIAAAAEAGVSEDVRKAIMEAAKAREIAYGVQAGKDFEANIIQPLRDELALYGLTGPARDYAALGLEKQAFMAKLVADGVENVEAAWQQYYDAKTALIDKDAAAEKEAERIRRVREEMDELTAAARAAGDAIANAFGRVGGAVGDAIYVLTEFRQRHAALTLQAEKDGWSQARIRKENDKLALQGITALTGATKNLFREHSTAYRAMAAAEKAFALVQLANTAVNVAAGAAKMFASLGPFAFPAVAAMVGVMAALGFSKGGASGGGVAPTNDGTGTVLGDASAKSESIRRAIDQLRQVDTVMLSYSREMAASLRSIESQIGGFASLLVRNADSINASGGVAEGFKANAIGSVLGAIPLVGGILKGLFGSKTTIQGTGLYGAPQALGSILNGGYQADYYTDIQKKKKMFGITTSTSYWTEYTGASAELENQFTLILKQFNNAILAAAGPLGQSTDAIAARLKSFVVNIGKIDLQGLTGAQIEEKLTAVFGAAADNMARSAFPLIDRFQKVGEGAFETLVRVASTVEAVTMSFDQLGRASAGMSIDVKMAVADQFDSLSAMSSAVDTYFKAFYTPAEQAAAQAAQLGKVFDSLGVAMPATLDAYRSLVDAQDLTTVAGRETYAALLQLAPAFADVKAAMEGAKSAADILAERMDLERKLLEVLGDTAALRALDLAKLDASNRALQEQIWAIQDAQAAAKAADELRKAWASVGDSIMDEVRRIRGLSDTTGAGSFASLMGQFNAATSAARAGDMDAAKSLPQLSQALLAAAQNAATSRQELDRVRAMAAASLEATYGLIGGGSGDATSDAALLSAASANASAGGASNDNLAGTMGAKLDELRAENEQMRKDLTAALAKIAGDTGKVARKLDDVTSSSGGTAVAVEIAA